MDKVEIKSSFSGSGAYEKFKELALIFYKEQNYKFVSLNLDKEPKENDVQFTVEFWSVENE